MNRICFDLDNTLCRTDGMDYASAQPMRDRIARVRQHYDLGEHITIDTGRAAKWKPLTITQLVTWDVPYHALRVGKKVPADVSVDDRAITADDFFGDATQGDWPDEYFVERNGTDPRRLASFRHEYDWLMPRVPFFGRVCDVGCSTGEFLESVSWAGPRYGMEINPHARRIAESHGIDFTKTIQTERDFFDVVVFRGTIQHLPEPFRAIRQAYQSLKSGGHIVFLATPNTGSLVYRLFGRLPASDDARNYWMPSASTLQNALRNFGFEIVAVEYPYMHGGYARPVRDAMSFVRRLAGFGRTDFPWPGNMMNLIGRKP